MPPELPIPPLEPKSVFWGAAFSSRSAAAAALYIALIALIARTSGVFYILFPAVGALAYDVFDRPYGAWARAPFLLVVTPVLTAAIGTFVTRHLAYGPFSVLVTIAGAILAIRLLRSPIAPAISVGLLPLVLGISSWGYPASVVVGTLPLAAFSIASRRFKRALSGSPPAVSIAIDVAKETRADHSWIVFFVGFLLVTIALVRLTGWRFVLFPPLAVLGFEMFAHPQVCPWSERPFVLPVACTLCATAGFVLATVFGQGPLTAAGSVILCVAVLRILDLYVPPALAIGLLPLIMTKPTFTFPIAVSMGTFVLTACFLIWRAYSRGRMRTGGQRQ